MMNKVCDRYQKKNYTRLFNILHSIPFKYEHPMDENRQSDGEDLRYRFAYECDLKDAEVAYYIDNTGCSVLEMLVAMAIRMDDMMYDEDPGLWFWGMMDSLELSQCDNEAIEEDFFSEDYILETVEKFMDRDFDPNTGIGSPFALEDNHGEDLRKVEFWCLAMWRTHEVNGVM